MRFVNQLSFQIKNYVDQTKAYNSFLKIQATCYKSILNTNDQNKGLYMNNDDRVYYAMENEYNNITIPLNGPFYEYAKKLIGTNRKNRRKMLKATARIHNEMKKACKKENIGNNASAQLNKSIKLFRKAFRTSFINFSYSLPVELYEKIPDSLTITINGNQHSIINLYFLDENTGKYRFCQEYINCKEIKKEVQFKIAPYVFDYYNSNH